MRTPVALAAYAAGLGVVFAAAFGMGSVLNPLATDASQHAAGAAEPHAKDAQAEDGSGSPSHPGTSTAAQPGLAVSDSGYALRPRRTALPRGTAVPFEFTITRPDGTPLTTYTRTSEKELHLIVVRRDLQHFQHVHPVRTETGSWQVPLNLPAGGVYRVVADFTPAGLSRGLTLGTDVFVPGEFTPIAPAAATATARVGGYEVALDAAPVAGRETELTFTVTRDRRKVTDLQPYLGAFGHLVSLRTGDLAYLHTHPADEALERERGGPDVRFITEFPTASTYRLFLDFKVDDVVRTAEFTVVVPPRADRTPTSPASPTASSDGHAH